MERHGPDEEIRRLEREAAAGDREARNALVEERARRNGQPIELEKYQAASAICLDAASRLAQVLVGQCAKPHSDGTTCRDLFGPNRTDYALYADSVICGACRAVLLVEHAARKLADEVETVTDAAKWNERTVDDELIARWARHKPWWNGSFQARPPEREGAVAGWPPCPAQIRVEPGRGQGDAGVAIHAGRGGAERTSFPVIAAGRGGGSCPCPCHWSPEEVAAWEASSRGGAIGAFVSAGPGCAQACLCPCHRRTR